MKKSNRIIFVLISTMFINLWITQYSIKTQIEPLQERVAIHNTELSKANEKALENEIYYNNRLIRLEEQLKDMYEMENLQDQLQNVKDSLQNYVDEGLLIK